MSCASCHDPAAGGTMRTPRPTGKVDGKPLFNVPTIFNVANNHMFGWRGTIRSLTNSTRKCCSIPTSWGPNGMLSYQSLMARRPTRKHWHRVTSS
ncbi:cytochrome c peroxidase [Rhizobium etli]